MNPNLLFKFRLYVAGDTPNSMQAMANLTLFCQEHLANRHQIEIVDVLKHPMRALLDGILMTPTLLKVAPLPARTIVGTLVDSQPLLHALGLASAAA